MEKAVSAFLHLDSLTMVPASKSYEEQKFQSRDGVLVWTSGAGEDKKTKLFIDFADKR